MAKFKEIRDEGANPNAPTVAQMRESQRLGSVGKGTDSQEYCDMQADFAMGSGDVSTDAKKDSSGYEEPWM